MRRLARFVTRKWPEPVYELRRELGLPKGKNPIFDAKHSPNLVLALFSRVLGTEQKDWPEQHADHRILLLRCRRGQRGAAGAA
jgi:rhamnosyltransferase subunit B